MVVLDLHPLLDMLEVGGSIPSPPTTSFLHLASRSLRSTFVSAIRADHAGDVMDHLTGTKPIQLGDKAVEIVLTSHHRYPLALSAHDRTQPSARLQ